MRDVGIDGGAKWSEDLVGHRKADKSTVSQHPKYRYACCVPTRYKVLDLSLRSSHHEIKGRYI